MDPNAPVQPNQPQQTFPPVQPQVAVPATAPSSAPQTTCAGFGQRFAAAIIDSVIVLIVQFCIQFPITMITGSKPGSATAGLAQTLATIAGFAYYVYFTYKTGATLGKKTLKIRVVREDGTKLTLLGTILREVVGKIVSAFALGLGYLWMLWDKKKQTWHDKIAKTIVVKV